LVRDLVRLIPEAQRTTRKTCSWDQLVGFVVEAANGFFRPLQVPSEIRRALEEVEKERPHRILEIGTALGGTLFLLSRAADEDAILISLDLPGGKWGGGYSRWKTFVFRRFSLARQVLYFVRDDSQNLRCCDRVKTLLDGSLLDVLFIDGDHSYEGVKRDFTLYRDLVRSGGLILFHDIAHHRPERRCEVDCFWREVKDRYPSLEIIENPNQGWAGIGVLRNQPLTS
jgi:hypothetical protein